MDKGRCFGALVLTIACAAWAGCGDSSDPAGGGHESSSGGASSGGSTSDGGASTHGGASSDGGSTSDGGAAPVGGAGTGGGGGAAEGGASEGGGGQGGSVATDHTELCPMDTMDDIYSGFLPPNPYGDLPDADACVAQPHDAAIVLGCPNNDDGTPAACQTDRADIAASLRDNGYATEFIVTGAAVHNQYVEAQTLHDLLVARGIDDSHIYLDVLAQHTDENLYYSTQIMIQHGWKSAFVVSEDPGHLVNTAVCDSNCCVDLGRLTIVELPPTGVVIGHYGLFPEGQPIAQAECDTIEPFNKAMCLNLSSRKACKDNFQL